MFSLPITNSAPTAAAASGDGFRTQSDRAPSDRKTRAPGELSEEERQQVQKLRATDAKVHAHEMAHLAAAGPYAAGGASYQFARGPDGQLYAVGGEVPIDTSPVPGDPNATIQKMETVIRAAHAPADPSAQDNAVAAQAAQAIAQAQQEKIRDQQQKTGRQHRGGVDIVA